MTSSDSKESQPPDPLRPIWESIWSRRPILEDIMKKHGAKTLYDYTKDFFDVNPTSRLDMRKEELIVIVENILTERLDTKVAKGVGRQLRKLALISTADHHGIITSPFFVNSNIITGLRYFEINDPDLKYLIDFSFATVSLNNSSQPRSLLMYGDLNASEEVIKLPLLPDKEKMGTVYRMRPYTAEDIANTKRILQSKEKEGGIKPEKVAKVTQLLEDIFSSADVLSAPDFSAQITKINFQLWPHLFHPQKKTVPDLIYIDIESIVTELLIKHHLYNSSIIKRLLFDSKYQTLALKHFNNIPGAFSLEKDWGTYMFWALDEKNHRVRLLFENNQISSRDGTYKFEMTPASIQKALAQKQIFPSMILCYIIVAFYYGMKCLGGFCQVSDLTRTKEAWSDLLTETDEAEEASALEPVQTKELGGDGMVLAYLSNRRGELFPANALDMILQPQNTPWERYPALAQKLTFQEIMNPLILEIYKVLFPEDQRNPDYMNLTPEEILESTKLKQKILPMLAT